MKTLRSQLALFDGKRTDELERIAVSITEDPRALVRLATIAEEDPDDPVALAATWVILALLQDRRGAPAGRAVVLRLVRILERTDRWETRLHVLQALERIELVSMLTPPQLRSLAMIAMTTAKDSKPFVRAWSLNLLGLIGGRLSPDLQRRVSRLITEAEDRESSSIKARIRRLRGAGGLTWIASGTDAKDALCE